ncbi:MAG: hypothetical protein LBU22_13070 [Dysgonamonadaceae bacterium]|jgi:hypothetical protein|nr:hypothetical protein [Dysgonamonadaceae bacterium]
MENVKAVILPGIVFGVLMGIFYVFQSGVITTAIISGVISGLLFGIGMYFFTVSKTLKRQAQIKIAEGEDLIFSGAANHFVNREGVGGQLYLLSNKIQFQSHNFNIQPHGLVIEIKQIKKVAFYNILGIIPTGISIYTKDGKQEKFVVNNRKIWKENIEKIISEGN